jgi:hypothetical protein
MATVRDVPNSFRVYMQKVPPHPSWTAWRIRTNGVLTVGDGAATFQSGMAEALVLTSIRRVEKGFRNQAHGKPLIPLVDTWVEVVYSSEEDPSVVYLNDARWFGLGIYLRHRPLVNALQTLVT